MKCLESDVMWYIADELMLVHTRIVRPMKCLESDVMWYIADELMLACTRIVYRTVEKCKELRLCS